MEEIPRARRVGLGVLLGLISGIAVTAITFIIFRLAGWVFPPYSLFDFMARVLPGAVVTFGIDLLVGIITNFDLGSTAETAKLAEQSIAVVQFVVLGGALGGLIGVLPYHTDFGRAPWYGASLGLVLAALFFGVEAFLNFPSMDPLNSLIWLVIVFAGWGLSQGKMLGEMFLARSQSPESTLSRRSIIYLGGTGLLAFIASTFGLGILLRERQRQAEIAAEPTVVSAQTGGEAASPSAEQLAGRIQPVEGTRPELTPSDDFYRIDINTVPPSVDGESWQLEVTGLVDNPTSLSLSEIRALPSVSQYITLSCISNRLGGDLISTALWTGVRLKDFLDDLGLQPEADALYIESEDGFYETVVMEDIQDDRTLLVYGMNGEPLPQEHGFPLRIYIPNRYGMKQPKWIVRMEVIAQERPGYWVDRGWSETAVMKTTSMIDVVSVETTDDGRTLVGGVAHAGERGISKVEVQIDNGDWQEAELRLPALSPLTWIQWRFEDTIPEGNHLAGVRAYDGTGALQVLEENTPHPDGATGIHTHSFNV